MLGGSWAPVWGFLLPLLPAAATAWAVDRLTDRSRFRPPGFELTSRRLGMSALLTGVFFFGIFLPVTSALSGLEPDPDSIAAGELFLLHAILLAALVGWYALAYGRLPEGAPQVLPNGEELREGPPRPGPLRALLAQCGLAPPHPLEELFFGISIGPFLWLAVILTMVALASGIQAVGAGRWLPQEISPLITFMAGLPVLLRLGLSLSAGFVEEVFFRGFLQGRMGILASSALFVLAHLTYGQPLMLVGIALLSLVFAQLTRWRHNVLPAMAAHAVFDAVQLLFMLPTQVPQAGSPPLGIC